MKKLVVLLFAAILSFTNFCFAQQDSLYITSATVDPGDTVTLSLLLQNESFAVGAFHVELISDDSTLANFYRVRRGEATQDFGYFTGVKLPDGLLSITGIASVPMAESDPLPVGFHELALIDIIVSDSIAGQTEVVVLFSTEDQYANVISDTSGYDVIEPHLSNGMITIREYVSVDDIDVTPSVFSLKGNYPNPFNSRTVIEFSINEPGFVALEIFDIQGRKIRNLLSDYLNSGNYSVGWNGCNENGTLLASGIYLYRLSSGSYKETGRMNFIK